MSVTDFLQFVSESPTAFHAVAAASKRLEQHGFSRLFEGQSWDLSAGQGYFVTRNQSSLIAFRIPEHWTHFQITASHSDSPMFKLKPHPVSPSVQAYVRLNVEKYGGAILSTWLDRPLSVAGRVLAETENGIQSHLIRLDELSLIIPNLPIHFNREVNSGYNFNVQQDLLPVLGDEADETALTASICEAAGIQSSQLLGTDLFLYNREAGCLWGARKQFFSSPRIDDLECAYTSLVSFLSSKPGFLLKRFLGAHPGFDRSDLQGYLNLFHVIANPPEDKMEKAAVVLNRAMQCPKTVRFRSFYNVKAR